VRLLESIIISISCNPVLKHDVSIARKEASDLANTVFGIGGKEKAHRCGLNRCFWLTRNCVCATSILLDLVFGGVGDGGIGLVEPAGLSIERIGEGNVSERHIEVLLCYRDG
jgi:hypothetical protein